LQEIPSIATRGQAHEDGMMDPGVNSFVGNPGEIQTENSSPQGNKMSLSKASNTRLVRLARNGDELVPAGGASTTNEKSKSQLNSHFFTSRQR